MNLEEQKQAVSDFKTLGVAIIIIGFVLMLLSLANLLELKVIKAQNDYNMQMLESIDNNLRKK